MLKYRIDVLQALKNKGYTSYRLEKEKLIGNKAMTDIRQGKVIGIKTIETICCLLDCQISDFIEYTPDKESD